MAATAWTILLLPLILALVIGFPLRRQGKLAAWAGTLGMLVTFILSLALLMQAPELESRRHAVLESSFNWMLIDGLPIELGIYLNGLTLLMLLVVTGISTLVFLFSMSYMEKDPGYTRYFASLSLFVFSMLGIVLANNFIQIFIFWELVGLSSYLLIGFWFEKKEASTASKKAFLTTRVGDVGMMIGILALFGFFASAGQGTFNFVLIQENLGSVPIPQGWMTFICIGLFLGVAGKSAQVPLHVWLPDAMEGPTPVSALIHAATMVAAGIFMLARVFFVFEASPDALQAIAWTGGLTCIVAALVAVVQNDIKKVLAYSTLSQLGYMVLALGLASPAAGMFHLTTHAFFKALLFLGSGSLIHAMHTQDIWEMSALVRDDAKQAGSAGRFHLFRKMPFTAWTFILATLALMGVPPLSGFFSKEEILAVASHGSTPLFWIALTTVLLTAFYMARLVTIVFFPAKREHSEHHSHGIHEGDWRIVTPLLILAVLSVIGGFFPIKDLVTGPHAHGHDAHHGALGLALLSLGFAAFGALSGFFLYANRTTDFLKTLPGVKTAAGVFERKFYFDDLYDLMIQYVQEKIARVMDIIERYVIVEWSVNGLARFTRSTGNLLRGLQTGMVQFYAFFFVAGISLMLYFYLIADKVR